MKKVMFIVLCFVLTVCLLTACGTRTENETSMPSTSQMTVPATTGSHNQTTNGGGVVDDIIEDVTSGMTGSVNGRHSTQSGR